MTTICICIVEDDCQLLNNLSLLLQGEPGFSVVAAVTNAEEALDSVDWTSVDLLLADIDLPGMSGVELIRSLKATHQALNCMAYTIYEDRSTVFAAIRAGACGYLLKGSSPRELIESLHELHAGGAPMSPKIARKVILDIQGEETGATDAESTLLSSREIEILQHVERGLSYKAIATALHISPHTVHTHIKNIYEKVQARSRSEALRKARNIGVL